MTSIGGTAKPRRGVDPIDDEVDDSSAPSAPRRANAKRGRIRVGIASLTAAAIALTGITIATLANSAQAASPGTAAVVAPFDRGSQTSRSSADREELDSAALSDQIAQRAASLTAINKDVASTQAADASAVRKASLEETQQGITTEAKRLQDELNKLQFPAEGKPGSPWGMRLHPILGYYRMHWGMDIGAACGSPLRAVYDGTVTSAAFDGASGNNVKIDHGTFRGKNLQTASLHMTRFIVSTGQKVKKGEVIGYVGSTGLSTECHLHFETLWGGTNVDPQPLLNNP